MTDGVDNTNSRTYGYDGQGRLTSAEGPWWGNDQGAFTYDALGNIRSKTLGTRQIDLSYSLTQSADTGETGTRSLSYDTRGNVKSSGGKQA